MKRLIRFFYSSTTINGLREALRRTTGGCAPQPAALMRKRFDYTPRTMFCIRFISLICTASIALNVYAEDHRTFFSIPGHFVTGMPERLTFARMRNMESNCDRCGFWMQSTAYFSKSTNGCKISEYFLPEEKHKLLVYEYKPSDPVSTTDTTQSQRDIEARNFNIKTDPNTPRAFRSLISFDPHYEAFGIGFVFKQVFRWDGTYPKAWFELAFPVEHIKTAMHLHETIIDNGGGVARAANGFPEAGLSKSPVVDSMEAAFRQHRWRFGKIDNRKKLDKWGIADIEFKVNWRGYRSDACRVNSAIGLIIPTGTTINAAQAAYLFSPVVGNNHHWGFIMDSHMDFEIFHHNDDVINILIDTAGRTLLSNYQVRSFDVKGKPWSRYMAIYRTQDDAEEAANDHLDMSGSPGINIFTSCVEVNPRNTYNAHCGILYEHCNYRLEAGYHLFVRNSESVEFPKTQRTNWKHHAAFKGINGNGATSLARTINNNFTDSNITNPSDFPDAIISIADLDLNSAAHPAFLTNIVYGALGHQWDIGNYPLMLSLGGSYEWSAPNTALDRWTVWGQFSMML